MTTIVADARTGEMVSDSKCTYGCTWSPITKIYRVGDELIGCAGDVKQWAQFLKWHKGGRRGARPKGDEYTVLILGPAGLRQWDSNGCEMPIERGFTAIGSGGHAAIAALMCGKTAAEAVEIATQIDPNSGGDLQRHTLKEM